MIRFNLDVRVTPADQIVIINNQLSGQHQTLVSLCAFGHISDCLTLWTHRQPLLFTLDCPLRRVPLVISNTVNLTRIVQSEQVFSDVVVVSNISRSRHEPALTYGFFVYLAIKCLIDTFFWYITSRLQYELIWIKLSFGVRR